MDFTKVLVTSIDNNFQLIYPKLKQLEKIYPHFKKWFFDKVVPEVRLNKRRIYVVIYNKRIVGILIAKKSDEKKICTIWIDEKYRNYGLSNILAYTAFCWLGTDKPKMSIQIDSLSQFTNFINHHKFSISHITDKELFYN